MSRIGLSNSNFVSLNFAWVKPRYLHFAFLAAFIIAPSAYAQCTNCTTTTVGGDVVHIFTSGAGSFTPPEGINSVQYLIVGGGGGGGGITSGANVGGAGGGGAGGVQQGTAPVTPLTPYSITIGDGGSGGIGGTAPGGNGENSIFGAIVASGGGGGASVGDSGGEDGGSGGGGRLDGSGGSGASGEGNSGGDGAGGTTVTGAAGGGGGAGGAGSDGAGNTGGTGGAGVTTNILGFSLTIAGGGGGGGFGSNGGAGVAGGGNAPNSRGAGAAGAANTGGGGGGASGSAGNGSAYSGGQGGSGGIVIRYTPGGTRYAVDNNGNWNSTSTWSSSSCAGGSGASVPTAADDVVICNNRTINITSAAAARSLLFESGNRGISLVHTGGAALTVGSGGVTILPSTNNNRVRLWDIDAGNAAVNGPVAVIGGNGNGRNSRIDLSSGTLDINGDLTINSNNIDRAVIETTGAATISLSGSFNVTGGSASLVPGSDSTFIYDGTGTQTALLGVSDINYHNLVLGGSGTKNQTTNSTPTITGTTTVSTGVTFNNSASVIYQGDFVNGGTTAASATHQYQGNFINGGTYTASAAQQYQGNFTNTGTFNSGIGLHTFNGAGAQQITGATTFAWLALDNVAGLTINDDVTVQTQLNLVSGPIITGANTFRVAQTGGWSGVNRTAGWVAGNLGLWMPTGFQTRTFDIGDQTAHRPLMITIPNVTSAGYVVASTSQSSGDHPQIATSDLDGAASVNRWWSIASEGVLMASMDVTYNYLAGDIDAGADPNLFEVQQYSSGTWTDVAVGTRSGTSTQATGITAFGEFAIAEPSGSTGGTFTCPSGGDLTPGLVGSYYDSDTPTGTPVGERVDGPVDFNWGTGNPGVAGIGADDFAVRWDGYVRTTVAGNYQFETVSDDGVRLWVDGVLVIDNWDDHGSETDTTGNISLAADEVYSIRLEYYENGGDAVIRLRWDPPGSGTTAIPAGPSPTLGAGLYYCSEPASLPSLVAEFRMDEDIWNGTAGEVLDVSSSAQHGTAFGGATTDGVDPAIAGDPGTCRYGEFDGVDDYVEVSGLSSTLNGTASLAFWIRTSQTGNNTNYLAPGVTGVEEAGGTDDIYWGWLDGSGRIGLTVGDAVDPGSGGTSTTSVNDNVWHHVVLTRNETGGTFKIYVDGILENSGSIPTGTIGNSFTSIGRIQDTGGTPVYFAGQLDELRVYDGVLSDAQAAAIMAETHPCTANLCPASPVGGLVGEYFNDLALTAPPAGSRVDGPIDFQWLDGVAPGVSGVNEDVFSVRWEGILRPAISGNYQFQVRADDGVRLWIDGVLVIDQWILQSATNHDSGVISLAAGQAYDIRLEYFENQTDAEIRLRWLVPGTGAFVAIPAGPTPTLGAGLYHCPSGIPDHYTIDVSATGITCEAEPVVITARDASGTAMVPAAGTQIVLSTDPNTGNWANGAIYLFTGTESFTLNAVQQITPATLNLHVTDGLATEILSPAVTFANVGLRFYEDNTASAPLPNQIAGMEDPDTVIRVVETDTETGACIPRIANTTLDVNLAYECVDPEACAGGQTLSIGSVPVASNDFGAAPISYTLIENLPFDANGFAPISLEYSDVGRVQLHGQLTLEAAGDEPEITLTNSSTNFVVKPHTLAVVAVETAGGSANLGGEGNGSAFVAAGEAFTVRVEARNADGDRTPSFGSESPPETISLNLTGVSYPAGGNLGNLAGTNAFGVMGASPGVLESTTVSWDEVGSMAFEPVLADGDYMASGDVLNRMGSGTVGRFYPYQYRVSADTTSDSCGFFSYMDEPAIQVDYQVTAERFGGGAVTNYDNTNLAYIDNADIFYVAENGDNGTNLGYGGDGRVAAMDDALWNDGVMDVDDDFAVFTRQSSGAPDGRFMQLQLGVIVDDADNRDVVGLDMNPDTTGDCTTDSSCSAKMLGSELELRYGRLYLQDAFGPETAPLPVTFITQYWDGAEWLINTGDDCTAIADTDITFNGTPLATSSTVAVGGGATQGNFIDHSGGLVHFQDGSALTSFSAPGAGFTGSFTMGVSLAAYPWLQFDWNDDGSFNDASVPPGNFNFGSYRGHDRIIYWQEVLN